MWFGVLFGSGCHVGGWRSITGVEVYKSVNTGHIGNVFDVLLALIENFSITIRGSGLRLGSG